MTYQPKAKCECCQTKPAKQVWQVREKGMKYFLNGVPARGTTFTTCGKRCAREAAFGPASTSRLPSDVRFTLLETL